MKDKEKDKTQKFKIIEVEHDVQSKILKLLDKQLQVLEYEVNLLKFKIAHNKMSDEELEIIYESLAVTIDLED